ncbi:MAG: T9SS type A sorting domain-containing protein [Bacteroidota bacterium]
MKKTLLVAVTSLFSFLSLTAQLSEGFDFPTFPPVGWQNLHTTGSDPVVWERAGESSLGGELTSGFFFVSPHSGDGMAAFASYDFAAGNGANLISSVVNLSSGGSNIVSLWMYRDEGFDERDSINIFVNTTQSPAGATLLGTLFRYKAYAPAETAADGWFQYQFVIPASFNTATNYIIFSAGSAYGNNIFIDDIYAGPVPTCGKPNSLSLTNFNLGALTASIEWTAPALGSAQGYEYAVNTTGLPPASGTAVAGLTATVPGLTAGAINYIFVRTNCGGGSFSVWSSLALSVLPCATLVSPANAATNLPYNQTFSWQAVTGANSYAFFLGPTPGNEVYVRNVAGLSTVWNILAPQTTYYWYVVPVIDGVLSPEVCSSRSFTMGAEAPVAASPNNICSSAVSITNANIAGNAINSTSVNATISRGAEECNQAVGAPDDDVWFQFSTTSVTPSGTMTITPTATGIIDVVAQVYAATDCNNLGAPILCADATVQRNAEVINLSALSPNTHYFMRVYSWLADASARGAFSIQLSAGATLPVQLTSFSARRANGVNILTWITQQEINSKYFSIERSNDGVNFTAIGQVAAAGNSNAARTYTFTDQQPVKGNNYYRLRTFDIDNSSRLSDTRRVRNDGEADISLYPNPANDKISLDINAEKATRGNLSILDVSGKAVYQRMISINTGNTILPVQLNSLSAGSYIIKLQLEGEVITRRFNKQ